MLEYKTVLVNLGSFLQQEMQSNKYKNKVAIIHCTSKKDVLLTRMWAWRGFWSKHQSSRCTPELPRHETTPHRRTKSRLGYSLHTFTYCCCRLQNLRAKPHFFLYFCLCTSHSTMGSVVKLRHSVTDESDNDLYWLHSSSSKFKKWWG